MDINFCGVIKVTRKALEVMRELKTGGLIQQVTSIGGQLAPPTFSIYCASKWAVEGFTEAVSKEVKPEWGIKFTLVEPGGNYPTTTRRMSTHLEPPLECPLVAQI